MFGGRARKQSKSRPFKVIQQFIKADADAVCKEIGNFACFVIVSENSDRCRGIAVFCDVLEQITDIELR